MDRETAETLVDALDAAGGIVALVGAGGKKSTLQRLLQAHRTLGSRRIALASTVPVFASPQKLGVERLNVDPADIDAALAETGGRAGAWFFTGPSDHPRRLSGLAGTLIPRLHEAGDFDVSLVKADGARMRMIKAPADYEPALPEGATTVLPIVSARAFNRPIGEALVHRPERFAWIVDAELGAMITPLHVARLLSSEQGALQRTGNASIVPVINMVDDADRLALARRAAEAALTMTDRITRVVLASMLRVQPLVDVITA